MVAGILLLAFVALAVGGVALMVAPAVDRVLNSAAVCSLLALVQLPWSGRTIYLNDFFPPRIHNVSTVFAFALLILYFSKAVAEYLGTTEIQYVGQTDVIKV